MLTEAQPVIRANRVIVTAVFISFIAVLHSIYRQLSAAFGSSRRRHLASGVWRYTEFSGFHKTPMPPDNPPTCPIDDAVRVSLPQVIYRAGGFFGELSLRSLNNATISFPPLKRKGIDRAAIPE